MDFCAAKSSVVTNVVIPSSKSFVQIWGGKVSYIVHDSLYVMINNIVKIGFLSVLLVFAVFVLAADGLGIIRFQQVYAIRPPGGVTGVVGVSGGVGIMGGDAGIGTSGGTCTTPNCNTNGVSQNGAQGASGVPGTGMPGILLPTGNIGGGGTHGGGGGGTHG